MSSTRWSEVRGLTFQLGGPVAEERSAARFVRVSLVRRGGLLSRWFNVQETRAEATPHVADADLRHLGPGRLLSWRWLSEREAEELIGHRVATLEGLGYVEIDRSARPQEAWAWLRALVRRELSAGPAGDDAGLPVAERAASADGIGLALRRLDARAMGEGERMVPEIARLLGIGEGELRRSSPSVVATSRHAALAVVLPFLLAHADPTLVRIGEAWLAQMILAYELPPALVAQWLLEDGPLARGLVCRLEREGLALLGPTHLGELARGATRRDVRAAAEGWTRRFADA